MSRIVAITGATGFAGRHAVAELLGRGHKLRALARNPRSAELPSDVDVVAGDLGNVETLQSLTRGADAVVHIAGAVAALTQHEFFRVNAHGTVAIAEAAVHAGVKRFVHISSLSAREPALSAYGASKRAGEDAIAKLAHVLNAIIIRPPAVYGPGDRGTLPLIKELTHRIALIPGQSEARFSLIHARDLARIIGQAVDSDLQGTHEVSDGAPEGYSWKDLLSAAEAVRGGPILPVFLPRSVPVAVAAAAELWSRVSGKAGMVSQGKIRELYHRDWVARDTGLSLPDATRFAAGLPETIAWYRKTGWLP